MQLLRAIEMLALFIGIPMAMKWGYLPRNPIPILLIGAGLCLWALLADGSFDRGQLWNARDLLSRLRSVAIALLFALPLLYGLTRWLLPGELFALIRQRPGWWLAIMILYPLVSVYPQELIYRAFFFHRYGALLADPTVRVVASAAVFAVGHVFFRVPAVVLPLTFLGGLMFSYHYATSGSLLVASIEHALYGDLIFTIGLGRYFFHRG